MNTGLMVMSNLCYGLSNTFANISRYALATLPYAHMGHCPHSIFNNYGSYSIYDPYMNNCHNYAGFNDYGFGNYGSWEKYDYDAWRTAKEKTDAENNNNNNGKPKDNNDRAVSNYNANGQYDTPSWYENLKSKVAKGEALTENERKMKENYENLLRNQNLSAYQMDSNSNYLPGNVNGRKLSNLGNEIMKIYNLSNGWGNNINAISKILKGKTPEELAAIEHYFPEISGGKTLREIIKDSSSIWGFRWLNFNYDSAENLMNYLDEKTATINPTNAANALYQALNNHRIGGLGVDDEKVIKILEKIRRNKEFLEAVKEEYKNVGTSATDLETDIIDKWTLDSATKQRIVSLLNG